MLIAVFLPDNTKRDHPLSFKDTDLTEKHFGCVAFAKRKRREADWVKFVCEELPSMSLLRGGYIKWIRCRAALRVWSFTEVEVKCRTQIRGFFQRISFIDGLQALIILKPAKLSP